MAMPYASSARDTEISMHAHELSAEEKNCRAKERPQTADCVSCYTISQLSRLVNGPSSQG